MPFLGGRTLFRPSILTNARPVVIASISDAIATGQGYDWLDDTENCNNFILDDRRCEHRGEWPLCRSPHAVRANDPSRSEPAIRSFQRAGKKDTLKQDQGRERSPFVILIGARQHLFDGQFLCELSAILRSSPTPLIERRRFSLLGPFGRSSRADAGQKIFPDTGDVVGKQCPSLFASWMRQTLISASYS